MIEEKMSNDRTNYTRILFYLDDDFTSEDFRSPETLENLIFGTIYVKSRHTQFSNLNASSM